MIGKKVIVTAYDKGTTYHIEEVKSITKNGIKGIYAGYYNFQMAWENIKCIEVIDWHQKRIARAQQLRHKGLELLTEADNLENV